MTTEPRKPLTPKVLHILLALAEEPACGYQVGLKVEASSEGAIRMSPGTLYENLHRLAEQGLIEDAEAEAVDRANGRGQRFYRLTEAGVLAVRADVTRLSRDVARARSLPALGLG